MVGIRRQSQMDKVKTALREAVSYADEVTADERLRDDLRAAVGHGLEARDRIRGDVAVGSIATRLTNDRKLRRTVRAMLEDLDSATDRVRRRRRHRLRNGLLVLGGIGVLAAVVPSLRRWIGGRSSTASEHRDADIVPAV
jgi:hypothetical protein